VKNNSRFLYLLLALSVALVISACAPKATPTPIGVYIETSVAATMQVQATNDSLRALEQRLTQMAIPTATPAPTFTPMPSPSVAQTLATPLPTTGPMVTKPPIIPQPVAPTATATQANLCLKATLVSETIPDGSIKSPTETFIKTWTFKNAGTCTWTTEFDFSFVSDEKMDGANFDLTPSVAPGGEITISISMKAPNSVGDHTGLWGHSPTRAASLLVWVIWAPATFLCALS
jgi:hypothetical protein